MGDNSKHHETLGEFWDRMPTGQRIGFICFALTIILAALGVGYWFGRSNVESRVTKAEADKTLLEIEFRREIAKLDSELHREKQKPPIEYKLRLIHQDESLPELDKAEFDPRTMDEYAKDYRKKALAEDYRTTKINRPSLVTVGKRFDWRGYVQDVDQVGKRIGVLINLNTVPNFDLVSDPNDVEHSAWCYFDTDKYEPRLREFSVGDQIHLTGVMGETGSLYKCQLR